MIALQFPGSNDVFTSPDPDISDLPVWRGPDGDGNTCIVSAWHLSKEDLEEVNRTGVVWLMVLGNLHPAVCLRVDSPFKTNTDESDKA